MSKGGAGGGGMGTGNSTVSPKRVFKGGNGRHIATVLKRN